MSYSSKGQTLAYELEGIQFSLTVIRDFKELKHSQNTSGGWTPRQATSFLIQGCFWNISGWEFLWGLRARPGNAGFRLHKGSTGQGHEMQNVETLLTFTPSRAFPTFASGPSLPGMTLESLIRLTFLRKPCYSLNGQAQLNLSNPHGKQGHRADTIKLRLPVTDKAPTMKKKKEKLLKGSS